MLQFMNSRFSWPALNRLIAFTACALTLQLSAFLLNLTPDTKAFLAMAGLSATISATLFLWEKRFPIALLTLAGLIAFRCMSLADLADHAQIGILLFMCGMMMITGALRDLGVFSWVIQRVLSTPNLSGTRFTVILCFLSALLSCVTDEISAIVVMLALVFQVCDTLHIRATPFVIMTVIATNIGSAATMLGNPVSVYIGSRAEMTFIEFLLQATPTVLLCLIAVTGFFLIRYRRAVAEMTQKMEERRSGNRPLGPLQQLPCIRGFILLGATLFFLGFNPWIARLLQITAPGEVTALFMLTPLAIAGTYMVLGSSQSGQAMIQNINSRILFSFAELFMIVGALQVCGVTDAIVSGIHSVSRDKPELIEAAVLGFSATGSAFVDNMIFVSAFSPVIESLAESSAALSKLWWALLFGACFGGNITIIGSTANLIAMGMLNKRAPLRIYFWEWIQTGSVATLLSILIAWLLL